MGDTQSGDMKVIEAFWDKTTLNLPCYELEISADDSSNAIHNEINIIENQHERIYIVAKVPVKCILACNVLCERQFRFTESQIMYSISKSRFDLIKGSCFTGYEGVALQLVNCTAHLEKIIEQIKQNIFNTDRIALDDRFGVDLANIRYANWVRSAFLLSDIDLHEVRVDNTAIGFCMTKRAQSTVVGLLAGVYNHYKDSGYFYDILYNIISHYMARGYRAFKADVSANNMGVLKIYQSIGLMLTDIKYVFTKVKEG